MNEKFENQADGKAFNPRSTEEQMKQIRDGSNNDQFTNTDWPEETLRDAPMQNHYLTLSGGSANTTYRFSLGYREQGSVVIGIFLMARHNTKANVQSNLKN